MICEIPFFKGMTFHNHVAIIKDIVYHQWNFIAVLIVIFIQINDRNG